MPPTTSRHREEHVLGGEVVVAEIGALRVGGLEHRGTPRATAAPAARSGRRPAGASASSSSTRSRTIAGGDAQALEHGEHHALGLGDQRREHVGGRDLRVVLLARQSLGGAERLTGLARELVGVERHASTSGESNGFPKVDNITIKFIPATGATARRRAPRARRRAPRRGATNESRAARRRARRSPGIRIPGSTATSKISCDGALELAGRPTIVAGADVDDPDAAVALDTLGR